MWSKRSKTNIYINYRYNVEQFNASDSEYNFPPLIYRWRRTQLREQISLCLQRWPAEFTPRFARTMHFQLPLNERTTSAEGRRELAAPVGIGVRTSNERARNLPVFWSRCPVVAVFFATHRSFFAIYRGCCACVLDVMLIIVCDNSQLDCFSVW